MTRGATPTGRPIATPPPPWIAPPPPRMPPPPRAAPPPPPPPPPCRWAYAGDTTRHENAAAIAREPRVLEQVMADPYQAWLAGTPILSRIVTDQPFSDQARLGRVLALNRHIPDGLQGSSGHVLNGSERETPANT